MIYKVSYFRNLGCDVALKYFVGLEEVRCDVLFLVPEVYPVVMLPCVLPPDRYPLETAGA